VDGGVGGRAGTKLKAETSAAWHAGFVTTHRSFGGNAAVVVGYDSSWVLSGALAEELSTHSVADVRARRSSYSGSCTQHVRASKRVLGPRPHPGWGGCSVVTPSGPLERMVG
jgi:hypothetical protein